MLTKELKVAFAQMLFNDKDLIFGDCGPNLSKVEKQEKWIEIFIKLNAMGANIPDYKSLRDVEWSNMRRASEKKQMALRENEEKPDEEKVNMRPLTALDEMVLDILGKGKGTTQKSEVEIPENSPFLEPAFVAKIKYEDDEDEDNIGEDNDGSLGGQFDDYDPRGSHSTRRRKRKRGSNAVAPMTTASPVANMSILELGELRKKKLRLECTKLELEMERVPLECAKLELEIQKLQRDLLSGHHGGVM